MSADPTYEELASSLDDIAERAPWVTSVHVDVYSRSVLREIVASLDEGRVREQGDDDTAFLAFGYGGWRGLDVQVALRREGARNRRAS